MKRKRVPAPVGLPPLFAEWTRAMLPGPIPAEPNATCGSCAMLKAEDAAAEPGDHFYSQQTKCCTYLPELKNFLVGGILADEDPAAARGRATVEARIDAGLGVTPLGLERTAAYSTLYRSKPAAFGRAVALRCPHYLQDTGGCGVWRHRESTCATWFCKFERGETGRIFWRRLHDLLALSEAALGLHCLVELGIDREVIARFFPSRARASSTTGDGLGPDALDGKADRAFHRAVWGKWEGRERELYLGAAEIAASMRWSEVVELGGSEAELHLERLREAYAGLRSTELPPRLVRRHLEVLPTSGERARIVGYSDIDPLSAPKRLVDALHCFDGSRVGDALGRIEREHGFHVTEGLVRRLVDFGILGPGESQGGGA